MWIRFEAKITEIIDLGLWEYNEIYCKWAGRCEFWESGNSHDRNEWLIWWLDNSSLRNRDYYPKSNSFGIKIANTNWLGHIGNQENSIDYFYKFWKTSRVITCGKQRLWGDWRFERCEHTENNSRILFSAKRAWFRGSDRIRGGWQEISEKDENWETRWKTWEAVFELGDVFKVIKRGNWGTFFCDLVSGKLNWDKLI